MTHRSYRVAILGAGAIGCATAAFLSVQGVSAAMWSPTAKRLRQNKDGQAQFDCVGAVNMSIVVDQLSSLDSLSDYSHIFICLPASLYQQVLTAASPHWQDGQTIIVSGALSLVPLWIQNMAAANNARVTTVGWGTTLTTAHFLPDGRLHINALRDRIDMAWLAAPKGITGTGGESGMSPDEISPEAQNAYGDCQQLFGDRFLLADSLLASTLANINPIAHAAEVIPNLTRIDRGERWPLFGNFTSVVANMAEALDRERLALASRLGFSLPTLAKHYERSYHIPHGPLNEMAQAIEQKGAGPLGPNVLAHRYVMEDVPFGLVFLERLARACGIACPTLSACITLLESVYKDSFRNQNFLVESLLSDGSSVEELLIACKSACAAS